MTLFTLLRISLKLFMKIPGWPSTRRMKSLKDIWNLVGLEALHRPEGNLVCQKLRLELLLGTLIVGQAASHLTHQGFLMCHTFDPIPR